MLDRYADDDYIQLSLIDYIAKELVEAFELGVSLTEEGHEMDRAMGRV